jgi:hypothetical protein
MSKSKCKAVVFTHVKCSMIEHVACEMMAAQPKQPPKTDAPLLKLAFLCRRHSTPSDLWSNL